jgi:hypothetical protein
MNDFTTELLKTLLEGKDITEIFSIMSKVL